MQNIIYHFGFLRFTRIFALSFAMSAISIVAHAKSVNVDEIMTKSNDFKLITSFSYINLLSKNAFSGITQIQLPNSNSPISVPISTTTSQDYLAFSLYARYGVYKRVEIFSTVNAFWQHSVAKNDITNTYASNSTGDFGSWNVGVLVEAKREGKAPALMLGASVDIIERAYYQSGAKNLQYAKNYNFFATSYYTIDPIVLALQASFSLSLKKSHLSQSIDNGERISLRPMVYFAVNPYISLNAGISYQYQTRDNVNGSYLAPLGSSLGLNLGLAYEIMANLILFADAEFRENAQYKTSSISLMLSYKI